MIVSKKTGISTIGVIATAAIIVILAVTVYRLILNSKSTDIKLDKRTKLEMVLNSVAQNLMSRPQYVLNNLCRQTAPDCTTTTSSTVSANQQEFSHYHLGILLNKEGAPDTTGKFCISFAEECAFKLNGKLIEVTLVAKSLDNLIKDTQLTLRKARW